MSTWSLILSIPAALRDDADLLPVALEQSEPGWPSYTRAWPEIEPTHWLLHARAGEDFLEMIAEAKAGTLPSIDWAAHGLTEARVEAVVSALGVSAPGSTLDPDGAPISAPARISRQSWQR